MQHRVLTKLLLESFSLKPTTSVPSVDRNAGVIVSTQLPVFNPRISAGLLDIDVCRFEHGEQHQPFFEQVPGTRRGPRLTSRNIHIHFHRTALASEMDFAAPG